MAQCDQAKADLQARADSLHAAATADNAAADKLDADALKLEQAAAKTVICRDALVALQDPDMALGIQYLNGQMQSQNNQAASMRGESANVRARAQQEQSDGDKYAKAATALTPPPEPTLTGVDPAGGPVAGGTDVTLTGTAFTGATGVTFDQADATNLVVASDTSITCKAPAHAAGAVAVKVSTPGGFASKDPGYTYADAPTVASVSPAVGESGKATSVTITGTGFVDPATVKFGSGAATSVVVVSATSITCTTPAGATGKVAVEVTTPGGKGSKANAFEFMPKPAVTSLDVTTGPKAGGTQVVITGTGFANGTAVKFGTVAATNISYDSDTQITCKSPAASAAGAVDVSVTNPVGTGTKTGAFTYTDS